MTLDHLVFGASDLQSGVTWMTAQLGQKPLAWGVHAAMGTHNALWQLNGVYMEVIAINPDAPAPRPRWFGLDQSQVQARIAQAPQLLTYVIAVADLASHDLGALGAATPLSRDTLHWQLTVPADGIMPENGQMPVLIEWAAGSPSPATSLPSQGLSLQNLKLNGATASTQKYVQALSAEISFGPPAALPLSATLRRADGSLVQF